MAQTQILPITEVAERFNRAAADLATTVDVLDRIASDASYTADRSEAASVQRTRMFNDALASFRAARDELYAATEVRELRRPAHVTERIEADL